MNNCVTPFIFYQLIFYYFFLYVNIVRQTEERVCAKLAGIWTKNKCIFITRAEYLWLYQPPDKDSQTFLESYNIMYLPTSYVYFMHIYLCIFSFTGEKCNL